MLSDLPPPKLIQDASGLDSLLEDLDGQTDIAVDTEADSFFSYREKVCLIQVTVEERDYLIDPLADLDLAPFGRILADPAKTKIFHDGEYDVMILKRDFGFSFAGLFDTRVAAAALGVANPGLASVLDDRFQLKLDKSMQRSNWSERPLTEKQISYARLDTRFLIPLMGEFKVELERAQRMMIVEGECRRLEQLEPAQATFSPDEFVRIKGARNLTPIQRQVLRELFKLREGMAADRNDPPFRVMNQQTLINLAKARPRTRADLKDVNGFTWKQVRRIGDEVLEALERAAELGPLNEFPVLPRKDGTGDLSDDEYELHERLKNWRKERARNEGLDSSLVLNRHVLLHLACERPRESSSLEGIDGLMPWQIEMFGDELLDVVQDFEKDRASGALSNGRRRGYRRR